MEVQFGPNPVDEPNLLYKLQRKIKVFNTDDSLPNRGYNLVTSSSKYGVVFVGSPDGILSVYQLKDLIDKDCEPSHLAIKLQERPTHIAVSCDYELLAVTGGQLLSVYKVAGFQNVNVAPAANIKLDANPSTFVSALQWNPCIPDNIAIAYFDGTLATITVSNSQLKKVQSKARCICWSPKGKQLVTGNSDGTLCQFKPDLTLAKMVPAPNLFEGAPVEALAICWVSTFQFVVVFKNAADNSRPAVTIVNTPKAGQPSCLNFEDICYSMGANRPWYYYLQALTQMNIILAASSNSMEIATLGSTDGANWAQWSQTDEARPELPLTDKKIENYPVGVSIDICGIHQLPWGENETLPRMPLLHVLSQSGLLTIFNIINLKSPQVCLPPQQLALLSLPANALTTELPGGMPPAVQPPPSATAVAKLQPPAPSQAQATPLPQPAPAFPAAQTPQPAFSTGGLSSMFGQTKPFGAQSQNTTAFSAAPAPKPAEPPKTAEVKPSPAAPQTQPPAAQPQQPLPSSKRPQATEENAALKAEQERVNKLKADQELKNMLVKEVNDFQMELYAFVVKTREVQNKLQQDLNAIDANFSFQSLDTQQLKRECDLEELRDAIVQLKLELVRACAVVAEARTHAEAKDQQQWTQVDPLTMKRVSSVKNLAYYVQSELEKAHKALDYKWNEMLMRDQHYKPGQRMIRPILDDVYQPLVKQQEILSRQQAVLRQLSNTLKEVDPSPMFKSTSLLRSTPFRNKDPLSKLTKNILNMSIEPQTNKAKDTWFTPQKLDALRDMLSNHKPTKIKPVNVGLRQHLTQMKLSYEKSIKEKTLQESVKEVTKTVPEPAPPQSTYVKFQMQPSMTMQAPVQPPMPTSGNVAKPDVIAKQTPQISIPTFTPVNQGAKSQLPGLNNVARTLFTDDKTPSPHAQPQPQQPQIPQKTPSQPQSMFGSAPPTSMAASPNTRSILKEMLQNKLTELAKDDSQNDANTFMGQKICSPSAFAFQPASTPPPTISFTSKPISDINNMFNKFTPQSFVEPKPQVASNKVQSGETGKIITPEPKPVETKKEEKSQGLFQIKVPPAAASTSIVPDIVKTNTQAVTKQEKIESKIEKIPETSKENVPEKIPEKSKEIVPEKAAENTTPPVIQKMSEAEKKENLPKFSSGIAKPLLGTSTANPLVTSAGVIQTSAPLKSTELKPDSQSDLKPDSKPEAPKIEKSEATAPPPSASSLFAAADAASPSASKSPSGPESHTELTAAHLTRATAASLDSAASTTETKTTKESTPPATTSASSLFASAAASQPFTKTTQSGSIFSSSSSTPSSIFGSSQGSIFGTKTTTTQSSSLFGTSTTQSVFGSAAAESKPSVFSTPTPASPAAVFGAANAAAPPTPTTTPSTPPAFGSTGSIFATTTSTTTPSSVFGSGTPAFGTTSSTASVFATTTTPTTATPSVFGSTSTSSIFGTAVSTPAAIFGSAATTAQSVFGSATATTQASIFGGATTQPSSIFGATTPTTKSSVFGATTQASVFGASAPSTQASVFGTSTTQASVFGAPTATTQASVFGQPTTTASGSLFGGADNLFASASISTTTAGSPTSGGSIFGGGGSSGSVFGGGGGNNASSNVFGGKSSFGGTANSQAAAIFGGGGATSFGQKPASNFWSGGSNTSGGTAFGSSGFGQQATTQASSIFGGSTGGSFSSPSGGQPFGSPQQQTSVFGSPQQTSPAFGGSPVFGSKPAFGQPAAFGSPASGVGFGSFGGFNKSPSSGFGSPAAFGGPPAFGGPAFGGTSPGKMFGGTAPAPSFGTTQSNSTFEQLATQNTLTFGNLAQQSPQQPQPAPTFNTSPSFTGWRG